MCSLGAVRDSNGKMITTKKTNSDAPRWVEAKEERDVVMYKRKKEQRKERKKRNRES